MYFCEKRELNCLKRLILQRIIYIILMDSNNLTPLRKGIVGVQFLFVAFGATVLVPLLVGLDPSTALFTAGIGTLIFHAVTRGKVPIFLGSSFAFIAPIIKATELYGLPGTLSGMVGVALVYFVMSALVKWQGIRVIEKLFPPVVIGPVIILIGLSLAGTGVNMAKENVPEGSYLADKKVTAKAVFDGAKEGDAYCMEVVEKFGRYLGVALSNVAHVVDPEAFVIGGGVSAAGQILLDVVEKYYNENSMFALKNKSFHLAELGNDAGIYGAVRMVLFK